MRFLIRERHLPGGRHVLSVNDVTDQGRKPTTIDNRPRYGGALELERRLYESAISSVEQTFGKESLVAAFLTSGSIVAFASSLQAFSGVAAQVGQRTSWLVTAMLAISLAVLMISIFRFASVLRGWDVKDLSDAISFLDEAPQPVSEDEVALKLIAEYRQARLNHEELVKARLKNLFGAMWWLGAASLLAFGAILVAFVSVSIHQKPKVPDSPKAQAIVSRDISAVSRTYNSGMASSSTQRPRPTVLPKPGSGTVMTKGGGGDGARK